VIDQRKQRIRIADLGRVVTGRTPPTKQPELYGSSYPFITPTDIGDGSRYVEPARFISERGKDKHSSAMLPPNAVCFTCIASIGKICMTRQFSLTNQQINSVVVEQAKYDPQYVFYLLRTETERIKSIASGVATPIIHKSAFSEIEVEVPPPPTQRKIAAILSAYDDLIENNLQRIKILEEMAQNFYREWFVRFRFPGHQHACFTDSPLGRIPEGWQFQRLDELCSAVLDGDWIETKDQGGEDYRLLQISNIGLGDFVETGKFRYVTQETFDRLRCTEIRPDDLLIARMPAPIGRGWLARKMPWRTITAVDVAIARPDSRRISPVFLVHFWNQPSTLAAIEKQSSGTTRLRITRRGLCAMPIPTPPLDLQEQFSAKARPMLDLCNILRDKNTSLRRTRDLLLPRLISGEVDVAELDIAVPEEASA
jgi:type I restriction enzyme S subunit